MTAITFKRTLGTIAAAGVALGAPLAIGTGTASAHDWSGVAQCESGGNWSTNTGNGFSGGLQFTPSTWHANGGTGSPENASKAEQIRVAENVLDTQGPGAWPVCGQYLQGGSGPAQAQTVSDQQQAPQQTQQSATSDQGGGQATDQGQDSNTPVQDAIDSAMTKNDDGTYTVQVGDTLSQIATAFDVQLDELAPQVDDVDLIFPGKVLDLLP